MAEAAPAQSLRHLLSRLREGPHLLVIPHFVLGLNLVLADAMSPHDRALFITGLMEPLLAAFQEDGAQRYVFAQVHSVVHCSFNL